MNFGWQYDAIASDISQVEHGLTQSEKRLELSDVIPIRATFLPPAGRTRHVLIHV